MPFALRWSSRSLIHRRERTKHIERGWREETALGHCPAMRPSVGAPLRFTRRSSSRDFTVPIFTLQAQEGRAGSGRIQATWDLLMAWPRFPSTRHGAQSSWAQPSYPRKLRPEEKKNPLNLLVWSSSSERLSSSSGAIMVIGAASCNPRVTISSAGSGRGIHAAATRGDLFAARRRFFSRHLARRKRASCGSVRSCGDQDASAAVITPSAAILARDGATDPALSDRLLVWKRRSCLQTLKRVAQSGHQGRPRAANAAHRHHRTLRRTGHRNECGDPALFGRERTRLTMLIKITRIDTSQTASPPAGIEKSAANLARVGGSCPRLEAGGSARCPIHRASAEGA